jgi:hypothetical protein
MLRKSLIVLKNNPLLILLFLLPILVYTIPMFFFMPDLKKIIDISKGITENPSNPPMVDLPQMTDMILSTMKMYLFMLVLGILGLIYAAGYGNMLAAAVNDGKASFKIFVFGIRKLLGKVILSVLLLVAISIGFGIVVSICTLPFTFIGLATNNLNPGKMFEFQIVLQIITLIISVFIYPFIELWLPAIFLERNDGVITCFKKGLRAGRKKYLLLVAVTAVMILPVLILYIVSGDIYSILESPIYFALLAYQVIIMPVILAYLFTIYNEFKKNQEVQFSEKNRGGI